MQQHGCKCFDTGRREKLSKFIFSEHGHDAYQINWNHEGSNMVAIILPVDLIPHSDLGMGSMGQPSFFSEHGHVA